MKLETNLLIETVLELMNRGADVVRVGKAAAYKDLTIDQMQQLNEQEGLEFEYNRFADIITITRAE